MLTRGRIRLKTWPLSPRARQLLHVGLVAGWMGLIFYLSQQSTPLGQHSGGMRSYLGHLVVYGALAMLLYRALRSGGSALDREGLALVLAVAFALTVLYGVTDELHQAFVRNRTASETDLAVDAIGALVGLAAGLTLDTGLERYRAQASRHP
ncbi:MAG: VanZ family protein [Dehalococcoidia bacterium]